MGKGNLLLVALVIAVAVGVLSGRPVPGALRKLAMNNNGRLFVAAKREGTGTGEQDGVHPNQIPPLLIPYANSAHGVDDYYDESEEIRCPPGTTLFFRSGQCVPDRCGFGMVRDHVTGDCVDDEDTANNIPIMNNFIDPISPRRPARGHGKASGFRGKPSKAIMRVLG